jgi:hypothetical protein
MTLDNATFRASIVSNILYHINLALPKGDNFFGKFKTNFSLSEVPTKKFYLDFRGLKIANLRINGHSV